VTIHELRCAKENEINSYLEAKARGQTSAAITKLMKLQATTAVRVLIDDNTHSVTGVLHYFLLIVDVMGVVDDCLRGSIE
jgi:hypothetical protein